ncbi:MerR family transcriptional regulator [Paenibacillus sp. DMB20]|uniref:MerR family transcriptional regulator n=1 Tax=Paenibacillus sp. DMB20 TaxID=1642570 RepID=UPI000627FAA0|nr:helix-turn-helix domain-containing protein [Paenibacillus sp. DMB20]KKO53502.1 MerR family transcriptional regulator [Paenibacillus sp. DMB20]
MKNLFSIGEVAEIKEITIKALRYYHKMGILIPKYIDETTGYRYYSIDQFIYIDVIKGCRNLGTSIKELQEIFKERNTNKLIKFLQLKRSEAEENLIRMKELISNIDNIDSSVEYAKNILSHDGQIFIKYFEERYIITAPCKEAGSLKELLYYSDLEKVIQEKKIKTSLERGIIYNLTAEGNLEPRYVFNGLQGYGDIEAEQNINILPEGKYVTLAYSKDNEEERIREIFNYVEKNNLKIKKFLEVELLNDFFNAESYSCQIQMLIQNGVSDQMVNCVR